MKFYTNVFQRGNKIYSRGYEDGRSFQNIEEYKPYLFLQGKGTEYSTINNKRVGKINFDSIAEAREFIRSYEDVEGFNIYGLTNFTYTYIYDNFRNMDYDTSLISIVSLDIEVDSADSFPDMEKADKEITAITVRKNGISYVFGCGDFTSEDENIKYMKCKDEHQLLSKFLALWNHIKPDIVTGWYVEFFDIPYLYNRICVILSKYLAETLSPWKIVQKRTVEIQNRESDIYDLIGITTLDYYRLYRKLKFSNQESYKLDYISQVEGVGNKLDYSKYGSLDSLYRNNFQKFIEYNIQDTILVDKLEEKLGFIQQVIAFAYDALVNYDDTLATVKPWDVIIHKHLMKKKIVIPQFKKQKMPGPLVGGYVKEPKIGLSRWVVSFDLDSLYPHLIMQYNISPDVFIERIPNFPSIDRIINGFYENKSEYSVTANGCVYSKEKQGFLAELMETMYNDRVKYKNLMIEAKKKYEETKDPELKKVIAKYHNSQLAKKIQLNSAYGALGNEYFRWFSFNHAEAVTTSGQLSVRWIEKDINIFLNNILMTDNLDYVIASDTDSIYLNLEPLAKTLGNVDELTIVKAIDKFCEVKIQPIINKSFESLYNTMGAYQQKMRMKRETIANKGIWKAAKMYILNAWNIEGVQFKKPELKMTGIEAVRSSTPNACRKAIKDSLNIIMNKSEEDLKYYVCSFRAKFNTLSFEEIAFPRGVNGLDKYSDKNTIYSKGTPIQVKGSLLFNSLLKKNGIKNIPPIKDGEKIKFTYLKKPNPINDTVIAAPDKLPIEFELDKYIDREEQFNKGFLEPLKSITNVIGWQPEQISTLEDFFS